MVVIAHYNESLEWLKEIKQPFIVYSKGEKALGTSVINIENKGREGDTWLRYIIAQYYYLPNVIYFLQGNPFEHYHDIIYLLKKNIAIKNYMSLGSMGINKTDADFGHLKVKETYKLIFGHERSSYQFATGAQYAVNKRMIIGKPLSWWQRLYEIYNDTPDNAWVFERLWIYIWKYQQVN